MERSGGAMKRERKLVDVKSFALAEHFLQDEPAATEDEKHSLAVDIQQAVEDWFFDRERRNETRAGR